MTTNPLNNNRKRFQTIYHPSLNARNVIELESLLHEVVRAHLSELIQTGDPRAKDLRMKEEIATETLYLARRGTFNVLMPAEIPPSVIVLTVRFLLAVKHKITGDVRFKARYVVEGYRDKLKASLVQGIQTLRPISARLRVAIAAMVNFKFRSTGVKLVYFQADKPLHPKAYQQICH